MRRAENGADMHSDAAYGAGITDSGGMGDSLTRMVVNLVSNETVVVNLFFPAENDSDMQSDPNPQHDRPTAIPPRTVSWLSH